MMADRGLFSSWATMETNLFLSCSAFQVSVTSLRMTIAPPASPSRSSGEMLPCSRRSPAFSWTRRHSGRSGRRVDHRLDGGGGVQVGKEVRQAHAFTEMGSQEMLGAGIHEHGLSADVEHHHPLVHRVDHLVGEVALAGELGEVLLPFAGPARPCCAARSTTQMRFSGLNGFTRKSKAPWRVTSTAASTDARADVMTTTVRPPKRREELLGERGPLDAGHGQGNKGHVGGRLGEHPQGLVAVGGGPHGAARGAPGSAGFPPASPPRGRSRARGSGSRSRAAIGRPWRLSRAGADGGTGIRHGWSSRRGTARSCPAGAPGAPAW